jgi:hypothetical protein
MAFPRIPQDDIILWCLDLWKSVSEPEHWGGLKFNSLRANVEP